MAQAIRPSRLRDRPVADAQHITRSDLSSHPRHFRGRHHAATIFVIALLAVVGFRAFPTRDVTVISNGQAYTVSATFDPRSEALEAARVNLAPGDRVVFASGGRHSSLAVDRANPVRIDVDGNSYEVRTQAASVAGALIDAGIDLRPGDQVYLEGRLTSARGPLSAAAYASRNAPARAGAAELPVSVSIVRARPVTVMVDTLRVEVNSAAQTVDALINELGMTIREGDLVHPGLQSEVTSGMTIRLDKARTVSVKLDGKDQVLYTQAHTVADVLRLLGVDPGPDEILSPPRDTVVTNGMSVVIGLNRTVEEETRDSIAPPVEHRTDPSLPAGTEKVIPGKEGVRVTRFAVTYKNGESVDRRLMESFVEAQPSPVIYITGSAASASAKTPPRTLETPEFTGTFTKKIESVRATYYTAAQGSRAPGDPNYGMTYSGVLVDYGICAVDPTVIPLGTRFWVPGYGACLAADIGGGVKGNHIDLGYPEAAATRGAPWATQYVDIYILPAD